MTATLDLASTPPRTRHEIRWLSVALVVLVLSATLGISWGLARISGREAAPVVPDHAQVEATWGVRITSVTVTADGGLVDLRFVVLDSTKAAALMDDRSVAPRLLVDSGGEATLYPAMTMHREMSVGRTYFLLYRNTGGLVQPHAGISIVAGELRIDGVVPG